MSWEVKNLKNLFSIIILINQREEKITQTEKDTLKFLNNDLHSSKTKSNISETFFVHSANRRIIKFNCEILFVDLFSTLLYALIAFPSSHYRYEWVEYRKRVAHFTWVFDWQSFGSRCNFYIPSNSGTLEMWR